MTTVHIPRDRANKVKTNVQCFRSPSSLDNDRVVESSRHFPSFSLVECFLIRALLFVLGIITGLKTLLLLMRRVKLTAVTQLLSHFPSSLFQLKINCWKIKRLWFKSIVGVRVLLWLLKRKERSFLSYRKYKQFSIRV